MSRTKIQVICTRSRLYRACKTVQRWDLKEAVLSLGIKQDAEAPDYPVSLWLWSSYNLTSFCLWKSPTTTLAKSVSRWIKPIIAKKLEKPGIAAADRRIEIKQLRCDALWPIKRQHRFGSDKYDLSKRARDDCSKVDGIFQRHCRRYRECDARLEVVP